MAPLAARISATTSSTDASSTSTTWSATRAAPERRPGDEQRRQPRLVRRVGSSPGPAQIRWMSVAGRASSQTTQPAPEDRAGATDRLDDRPRGRDPTAGVGRASASAKASPLRAMQGELAVRREEVRPGPAAHLGDQGVVEQRPAEGVGEGASDVDLPDPIIPTRTIRAGIVELVTPPFWRSGGSARPHREDRRPAADRPTRPAIAASRAARSVERSTADGWIVTRTSGASAGAPSDGRDPLSRGHPVRAAPGPRSRPAARGPGPDQLELVRPTAGQRRPPPGSGARGAAACRLVRSPLEVLDDVRDEAARGRSRLRPGPRRGTARPARRTASPRGPPIARLLADQHPAGRHGALAEDGLCRTGPEVAGTARRRGVADGRQVGPPGLDGRVDPDGQLRIGGSGHIAPRAASPAFPSWSVAPCRKRVSSIAPTAPRIGPTT